MVQPVLCFQHAADMALSFESVKLTMPSLPAIVQLVVMPLILMSEGHVFPPQAVPKQLHPPQCFRDGASGDPSFLIRCCG